MEVGVWVVVCSSLVDVVTLWVVVGVSVVEVDVDVALSTFSGTVMELEWWVEVEDGGTKEEDEEEDTCEDVEAAAAELLERAMQRFERLRIFLTDATGATTAGSGSATGMAARCARARWLGPRAMCGLAVAERATVRTTRTLAKNMVACRS